MSTAAAARPTGVVVPQSQLRQSSTAAPRTVTGFAEAKTFGIEYTDDDGEKHTTVAMCIGGQWYMPPNGENYAATLRPIKSDTWLGKALEEGRLNTNATSLPKQDSVDVIGG